MDKAEIPSIADGLWKSLKVCSTDSVPIGLIERMLTAVHDAGWDERGEADEQAMWSNHVAGKEETTRICKVIQRVGRNTTKGKAKKNHD